MNKIETTGLQLSISVLLSSNVLFTKEVAFLKELDFEITGEVDIPFVF